MSVHGIAHLPDVATYHPAFKVPNKSAIFLTHYELLKLYNYQVPKSGKKLKLKDMSGREYEKTVLNPGALEKTRDLFCFCAFTSLGYSGMAILHKYYVHDGSISVVAQRTTTRLKIKLSSYALTILEKTMRILPRRPGAPLHLQPDNEPVPQGDPRALRFQ